QRPAGRDVDVSILPADRTPIHDLQPRARATVAGRVRAVRVQAWSGSPSLECTLADETGAVTVVFYGRRSVAGIRTGTVMSVEGTAGVHHGILAILNPVYTLLAEPPVPHAPQH
ncbi:MAG: nucleic acid binding OB-fold tRNA/helicase-type, partial [Ilumatobacteraceae bacterium]|nr:nucleic acid binding OB-fold tRNA/helicase-type [Ilumatobacteraceae bacterium]